MGYASYQTLAEGFGPGFNAPFVIVASLPSRQTSTSALASAIRHTRGVAQVSPAVISKDGAAALMVAYPATREQDQATNDTVNRLSDTVLPRATAGTGIRAYVGGPNAAVVEFTNLVDGRLLWMIGIVVVLSVLLLLVLFRSVTIAVTAAVMNLLSVSAAYGVLVAVVQWGWLRQVFGFPSTMPVASWVPLFLFVILFGLSMDYEVFLMSRIHEDYRRTGDNSGAVARGLSRTARVISAAAAIMVVVFLSVVLGADVTVKQFGLGLAVAVLIDATVVRLVLVPAVMELLGKANWWLPRWLGRLLPVVPVPEQGGANDELLPGQGDRTLGKVR
jgi:RND superfamily putative drug exporter